MRPAKSQIRKLLKLLEKSIAYFLILALTSLWLYIDWPQDTFNQQLPIPEARASTEITVDSAVSTTQTEHGGASPTVVFTSDSNGYAFYVDSTGVGAYAKTTNGGSSWNTPVTFDSQTDVTGIAVWYDQWSPGDTSGTLVHILTWDLADLYYRTLDTSNDSLSGSGVLNITSTNQAGTFAAGANWASITKSYSGGSYFIYAAIIDAADSFMLRCSANCTANISNWTEAGTNPFTSADNDAVILMPLANLDCLAIWWDQSANDVLSREYEDGGNTWAGSWTQVHTNGLNFEQNTTYDAAYAATLKKSTGDIYLAVVDDANTLGPNNDDISTSIYDGSSWTSKTDVITNDPSRGITGVAISYDSNTDDVYVLYSLVETVNYTSTANIYYKVSRDGMTNWDTELGPLNSFSSDFYGVRSNLINVEKIYVTWYDIMYDDLFGHIVADLAASTDRIYMGQTGTQTLGFSGNTADNYIGAAFTAIRNTGSADISSITISETGTMNAELNLSNLDIRYETAGTCTYDGGETLFGTDSAFSASDQGVVTGTMSIGTSQVCIYAIFDIGLNATGTIDIEIDNPAVDISVSSGVIMEHGRVKLKDTSNVQMAEMAAPVTIDATVSTLATEHTGPSPTTVFTTDQIGYNFYVDSDGRAKYSKTTNGGTSWNTAVIVDNQTDVLSLAVWYDQWSPGDTSGTLIHVATADAADTFYTTVNTSGDSVSTTLSVSGANQGGGFAAGANTVAITKSYSGGSYFVYIGIIDNSDSFVLRCSTSCTTTINNWTEAGTNPFTSAANDYLILMPLPNLDLLALWWDASADDILSREYEDGGNTWAGSWTQVHTNGLNIDENVSYDAGYAATVDIDTGTIYLVMVDDNGFMTDNSPSDILTSTYDGSSWTSTTSAITNDARIITQVAVTYDNINDDVYIVYSAINDWTNFVSGAVYAKLSTDGMSTWQPEFGSLTQYANREILALRTNIINSNRLYAMWYGAAADTIWGNNVRDLSNYTQSAYRFFSNADGTDVGSALAAQDNAATLTSDGQQFRLRLAIDLTTSQINDTGEWFKLQYAGKGGGSCASPAGTPSSYTDVSTNTVIAYAGNSPADGAALTDNANDPVHSGHTNNNQTYEEANNFSNTESAIPSGEDGLWDFSLIDYSAPDDTTYCFRVLLYDGLSLNTYSVYPEITSASGAVSPTLTFTISDNTIGFGTIHSADDFFATGDGNGSATEVEAHTIQASTNASSGYVILVSGTTLSFGGFSIDAIGCSNTASSPGTEQYGIRLTASGGDGTVSTPYENSGFALCTGSFPDEIASDADGDDVATTYSLRYLANIASNTEAGPYSSALSYIIVGSF